MANFNLASAPLWLQVTVLAATTWFAGESVKRTLVLHQQGFFKLAPNSVVVAATGLVCHLVTGNLLVTVLGSAGMLTVMLTVAGIRRGIVERKAWLANRDAYHKALFAHK